MEKVGKWAFVLSLVIAVVAGLGFEQTWFPFALALLGLLVGLLNIAASRPRGFYSQRLGSGSR